MPKLKYQQIIEAFCVRENINIPGGFYRGSSGNLVVIKKKENGWQLVATTWVKTSDVINYLTNYKDADCRIFDFKNGVELSWNESKKLIELNKI